MGKIRIPDLFYKKYGHGKETMLCFHGFGQEHSVFEKYTEAFPNHTIYSFDLFFHGKSNVNRKIKVNKDNFRQLFEKFLEEEKITKFSVIAFSIGAILALQLANTQKNKVQEIKLIAPHGLYSSCFFNFMSQSIIGNYILKSQIKKPSLFLLLMEINNKLKLIKPSLTYFAKKEMYSQSNRFRIYYTWTKLSKLQLKRTELIHLLHDQADKLEIFLAKKDEIINNDRIRKLKKTIPSLKISTIRCSHYAAIKAHLKMSYKRE